ncbi:MAG: hypothetical protein GTO14_04795 [Anaerolineales bacterium]|nr:hypothetical protein [Anaerolineales bacterium]
MAKQDKATEKETSRAWPPETTRQHLRAARAEMREAFKTLFPSGFIEHRRAARREMLLAARSMIDHALERMEKQD